MNGSSAPTMNATADEIAASHGLVSSSGSMRSSSLRVRGERIVSGQLGGGLARGLRGETSCFVKGGQLVQLGIGLQLQLLAFSVEHCPFGVALGADRHIFANRHRQRAGGQPRDARGEHRRPFSGSGGNADNNARRRDDPVVGAQDGGAKRVEFVGDRTVVWLRLTRREVLARSGL